MGGAEEPPSALQQGETDDELPDPGGPGGGGGAGGPLPGGRQDGRQQVTQSLPLVSSKSRKTV